MSCHVMLIVIAHSCIIYHTVELITHTFFFRTPSNSFWVFSLVCVGPSLPVRLDQTGESDSWGVDWCLSSEHEHIVAPSAKCAAKERCDHWDPRSEMLVCRSICERCTRKLTRSSSCQHSTLRGHNRGSTTSILGRNHEPS